MRVWKKALSLVLVAVLTLSTGISQMGSIIVHAADTLVDTVQVEGGLVQGVASDEDGV